MPSLGGQELIIILVIVMIIFGAGRLPEIGGSIGKSIKEFKSSVGDDQGAPAVAPKPAPATAPMAAAKAARAEEI